MVQAASLGQRPLHLERAFDLIRATRELMEGPKFLAEPIVVSRAARRVQDLEPDVAAGGHRIGREPGFPSRHHIRVRRAIPGAGIRQVQGYRCHRRVASKSFSLRSTPWPVRRAHAA